MALKTPYAIILEIRWASNAHHFDRKDHAGWWAVLHWSTPIDGPKEVLDGHVGTRYGELSLVSAVSQVLERAKAFGIEFHGKVEIVPIVPKRANRAMRADFGMPTTWQTDLESLAAMPEFADRLEFDAKNFLSPKGKGEFPKTAEDVLG